MNSKEQTKKKITVRDVMTIAAMMVLTIVVSGVTGPLTPAIPIPLPVRLRRTSDVSLRNILFGSLQIA